MSDSTLPVTSLTSSSPWLPLSGCISNLTVLFGLQRGFLRILGGWLPGVPYWDAKVRMGQHILQDAQNAEDLLKRLHELKATSAERKAMAHLEEVLKAIESAPSAEEWLQGFYTVAKPWLIGLLRGYLQKSDPVMDAPSRAVVARILENQLNQTAWFETFVPRYSSWAAPANSVWCAQLAAMFTDIKLTPTGLTASDISAERGSPVPDFAGFSEPRRDTTFRTIARLEARPPEETPAEHRIDIFWHHVQEMQFAESLGALLHETAEMPWAFHYDLARHLADEVRHSEMGEIQLERLGVSLRDVPYLTRNYAQRAGLDPVARFCLMTLVLEADSFESKRANAEWFRAQGDAISEHTQIFDSRDEMLHVHFGHLWVPVMLRVYHDSRSQAELIQHCRDLAAKG